MAATMHMNAPRAPLLLTARGVAIRATAAIELWLAPVLLLAIRLWLARIFFNSGLTKINDWTATLFLFEFEYQVPLLPATLAAVMGTAAELAMPVLLVLGLFGRLAALPLLGLTMVIEFAVGAANPVYSSPEHYNWMLLLATIFVFGPGRLSADRAIGGRHHAIGDGRDRG